MFRGNSFYGVGVPHPLSALTVGAEAAGRRATPRKKPESFHAIGCCLSGNTAMTLKP